MKPVEQSTFAQSQRLAKKGRKMASYDWHKISPEFVGFSSATDLQCTFIVDTIYNDKYASYHTEGSSGRPTQNPFAQRRQEDYDEVGDGIRVDTRSSSGEVIET